MREPTSSAFSWPWSFIGEQGCIKTLPISECISLNLKKIKFLYNSKILNNILIINKYVWHENCYLINILHSFELKFRKNPLLKSYNYFPCRFKRRVLNLKTSIQKGKQHLNPCHCWGVNLQETRDLWSKVKETIYVSFAIFYSNRKISLVSSNRS